MYATHSMQKQKRSKVNTKTLSQKLKRSAKNLKRSKNGFHEEK